MSYEVFVIKEVFILYFQSRKIMIKDLEPGGIFIDKVDDFRKV
jgi:hypothetical protein